MQFLLEYTTFIYSPALKSKFILDLGCLSFPTCVRHNFVSAQYLVNNFIKIYFYMSIDVDIIYIWIVTRHFWTFVPFVMALDLFQNLVSAQYL